MPIYEYRCDACGHQQEFLQRMTDAPLKKCPACGKSRLKKLLSAAGFQLKGSGWYVTDFRDGKGKTSATATTAKADAPAGGAQPAEGAAAKETPKPAAPSATPAGDSKS